MLYLPNSQNSAHREFFYGAGVSAVQTEKHPTTNLHHWTKAKEPAGHPLHYGNGVEFDTRYPQDLERLKALGMDTFRFSLFANRLLDEKCHFQQDGIDHYSRLIDKSLELGIRPIMTIQHFDQCGYQWHEPHAVDMFLDYAMKLMDLYADRVRYITPLNEAKVNASLPYMEGQIPVGKDPLSMLIAGNRMLTAIDNQATAHREVYKYAQQFNSIDDPLYILTAENVAHFEGYGNNPINHLAAEMTDYFDTNYFLTQLWGHFDILGLNYYWHRIFNISQSKIPGYETTDTGARMSPDHLADVMIKLIKFQRPILITEVGIADREDKYRAWYFEGITKAIVKAREQGADAIGMIVWSLLDNFEMWPHGYDAEYGFYEVERVTQERTARPSAFEIGRMLQEAGLLKQEV